MFKNILIPVAPDHGNDIADAIEVARRLASKNVHITLLGVVEEIPSYVAEYVTVKPAGKILDTVGAQLKVLADGQPDVTHEVVPGNPGVAIAEYAQKNDIDLIVVCSHRPGMQDYYLGSTASRVVRRAPCAVMVLR